MATAAKATPQAQDATRQYRGGLARTLIPTLITFTFFPLVLMGGAAYLRTRQLLRNQVAEQLRVQIIDQLSDVDLTMKTKRIRLDRIVRNSEFQAAAAQVVAPGATPDEALRTQIADLVRTLSAQGGRVVFNQYFIMNPAGQIVLASKPEWEGTQLAESGMFQTITQTERVSYTVFNFAPLYENQLALLTVSQVPGPGARVLGTMVGVTESNELQGILDNLASAGAGSEAFFLTDDGKLIGKDPYTTAMVQIQAPAENLAPIVSTLDQMMGKAALEPTSVDYQDAQGTRYFGEVMWMDSLHSGILYLVAAQRVFGALSSLIPFTVGIVLVSLVAMALVLSVGTRRVFQPLTNLAEITMKFSDGDFAQRAPVRTKDEIGLLSQAFNHMAEELTSLYRSLEERVQERTRQIRTAAEVAERITSTSNLGELLNRTSQLLIDQFNFYQASIFLVDRAKKFAVLRASSGPAASELMARGHRLEVGSASIVGWVTAHNQPRIAEDVTQDPMHFKNPLLPDTKSEAGIPIRVGPNVLGAIDVQSTDAGAFGTETVIMLQTLANQIAAAIQNITLAEAGQTDLQDVERIYRGSRDIVDARSKEEALTRAAQLVAEASLPALVLTVRGAGLELKSERDPNRPELGPMFQAVPMLEHHLPEVSRFVSGGPVIAESTSIGLPQALLTFTQQVAYRAVAFLPISQRDQLVGLIIVGSPSRPLNTSIIEPYAGLADMVGTSLERLVEREEVDHRLAQREALIQIGRAMTQLSEDLGDFYAELHAQIRANIGDFAFVVALYDAAHETINVPYAYQEGRVEKIESFPLGEGLTSILIRTGRPLILVEDAERRAQELGAKVVGRTARSWMGAPMMIKDAAIGALMVQDLDHDRAFDEHHLNFLVELASQVAAVVQNAQLLDQSRRRAYQLESAAEVAKDMSGSLDLGDLLGKAVNYMRERLGYYHAAIFLLDPKREYAVIREATGEAGAQLKRAGHKLAVNSRSIVGYVAGRGEPLIVGDTTKDATYFANPLLPDTRSEAAVPLRVGERIVGVLDVQSAHAFAFQADDLRTLQILADQLAIAVVNSELFAETQEHLSQHRLLQHITTSAASGTTLDEALQSAVAGLQVTLGGDRVSILLLDRENRTLEIKAAVGYAEDIYNLKVPVSNGITGWAAAHARALRVDDVLADPRYIEGSPNTRSELAVPLIFRNEVLGILNVESEEPAAYTETDEEMLTTLAGSLAAVIANARLLEQVRAQAERERVLFEITGKIRRAPDIQSILATTASELTRVVGARRAAIKVSTEGTNGEAPKEE